MDILRLALERARTAREAIEVIDGLLSEIGTGGAPGHRICLLYTSPGRTGDTCCKEIRIRLRPGSGGSCCRSGDQGGDELQVRRDVGSV